MDEMTRANLKTMIELYREQKTNVDFINFQETLKGMKEEVKDLKIHNPRTNSIANRLIQEIEKYQTIRYIGYTERFYEGKICDIKAMISELKALVNAPDSHELKEAKN